MKFPAFLLALGLGVTLAACSPSVPPEPAAPPGTTPKTTLVATYPHDSSYYTQGLEVAGPGLLVESVGLEGHSKVVLRRLDDAEPLKGAQLSKEIFAEGVTRVGDEYLQLTWKNQGGFRYDKDLKVLGVFHYKGEGWGLCYDPSKNVLYRSDGTSTLHLHDPETFKEISKVTLTDGAGKPLQNLNELECVDGFVWGNVWRTSYIVKLDPTSGKTVERVDLGFLVKKTEDAQGRSFSEEQVLNGIAYDKEQDLWYVTGKEWPKLYAIKIEES